MIRFKNINKSFGSLEVLHNINLDIQAPGVVALIGPNASGKTTFIKSILGMVVPDSGQILFENKDIKNQYTYRNRIGYMPQIGRYPDNMRVGQVIDMISDMGSENYSADRHLIDAYKLDEISHKFMRNLSGGTRQKVSAAIAFLFDTPVLILDEPTAGLDPLAAEILKKKILVEKEKGKLIIISSHILSELEELTTDILYLVEGKVKTFQSIDSLLLDTNAKHVREAIITLMQSHETAH